MLWVEVLNRAVEWLEPAAGVLLHPQAGAPVAPEAVAALQRDVELLRRVFTARAAAARLEASDAARLTQWLAAVTLEPAALASGVVAGPATGYAWPEFVARRRQGGTGEPFESLLSTSLVQLLGLPAAGLGAVVRRCEGLRRGPAPAGSWPDGEGAGAAVHRCPRLVWSARGSRFCSKSCSNASFAARKASSQPRYFAAKQGRYRKRQQRPQRPRRHPGAFVYMD